MQNSVIISYARSPFTPAHKGALAKVRPDDLVAQVISGVLARHPIPPEAIEDLILGCAFPEGEQGLNMARMVIFLAQLPVSIAGVTVNRFCGSSMQAIHNAHGSINAGAADICIAAGVESMSRIPMAGFNPMPHPELYQHYPQAYDAMGITAENLAKKYKISRKQQEEFAVHSHEKAVKAQNKGNFTEEIIPIQDKNEKIEKDGCLRSATTLKKLAELPPAFLKKGTVTAGTSSPLTDGASAVVIASEAYVKKNNITPLARVKSVAVSGCAPEIMGIGPVQATQKALMRAELRLKDIDIIEINEAFSAQTLAVCKELAIDKSKLNIEGGALALGHPLGASGARITGKAAQLLQKYDKKYALATMCIGGGQGIATILERVS